METLERLAGRLARDLNRLGSAEHDELLETATLVQELTEELEASSRDYEAEIESASRRIPRGTETILLVEGEREDRLPVRDLLIEQGYRVLEAATGGDALEIAEHFDGPIHLILTNVMLSDLSGREVAETAALRRPNLAVIYLSGYTDAEMFYYGVLSAGAATIQKPVRAEALAEKVRAALAVVVE